MSITLHASCVAIEGRAVLLRGAPGTGKSDLALRLIDRGAMLVSDDYTFVEARNGILYASPPPTIAGMIEVRGVGIVSRPHAGQVPVALLLDLDGVSERLPEPEREEIAGIALPRLPLAALEPSAPIKVEAALLLHGRPADCRA